MKRDFIYPSALPVDTRGVGGYHHISPMIHQQIDEKTLGAKLSFHSSVWSLWSTRGGGSQRRVHRTSAIMNVLLAMNHKYNSSKEVLWATTMFHLVSVWSAMRESANKMCLREVQRPFIVEHYYDIQYCSM